jgi:arginyl-tRNA synthetase
MTLKRRLEALLKEKILELYGLEIPVLFEFPREERFGDYATGVSFSIAKQLKKDPQSIAKALKDVIEEEIVSLVDRVDAISGFLNLKFRDSVLQNLLSDVAKPEFDYGRTDMGKGKRILLEYVSANPTGPLNVVNARAAAFGDTLARVMRETGFYVETEYYVNDAGGQIQALGGSIAWRQGRRDKPPEDGYLGEYLLPIAESLKDVPEEELGIRASQLILKDQLNTLMRFRVKFDNVVKESWVRDSEYIEKTKRLLSSYIYENEGAVFFRSTYFGDEKDRVLIRSNGEPTYFFYDIAYHLYKVERGFDLLINIWGPDHMGHIGRMKAALEASGIGGDKLDVIIVQQVNLLKGGERVRMSKRLGEFFTLDELIDEVGVDAARYFFLLRTSSAHLDFDMDLAKKMGKENPVYYVQYVHARVMSLLNHAKEQGITTDNADPSHLELQEERSILRKILYFPDILEEAATKYNVHLIPHYLLDLASLFHNYYQKVRIVGDDRGKSKARLLLAKGVGNVVRKGLNLMGVEAPERM